MKKKVMLMFTTLFIMMFLMACNKKELSESVPDILYGHVENEIISEEASYNFNLSKEAELTKSDLVNYEVNSDNYIYTNYPFA